MKQVWAIILLGLMSFKCFSWSEKLTSQWSLDSKEYSKELSAASFATFWGGMRRALYWPENQGEMISVRPEGFKKDLPVYLNYKKHQKRDLYIFYPGIFGRPDGLITPQVIDHIEKNKVHLIVLPNLVAPTYLVARPDLSGDGLNSEKLIQRKLLSEVLKKIDPSDISNIHVLAESLGSIQALTMLSPLSEININIASLTLMWPPLYLDRSIERFDQLIQRSEEVKKSCSLWLRWPGVLYETLYKVLPEKLQLEDKECFGAWVIGTSFVDSIKDTSEKISERNDHPVFFKDFISTHLSELKPLIESRDPRLSVDKLLAGLKGKTRIRIVSSVDDFLNVPEEWDVLKKNHPDLASYMYLFPWGGHCGPSAVDGFIDSIIQDQKI